MFAIPIEHKYDKPLRHVAAKIVLPDVCVGGLFDRNLYFYASDIAMLLLFLGAVAWFRNRRSSLIANCLWVIFVCAVASIVCSPLKGCIIPYSRLLQLFTPFALFAFLTQLPMMENKSRLFVRMFVAAALLQSAIAIAQYFTQAPLGLRLFGEQSQTALFSIPEGKRFLFDFFTDYNGSAEVRRSAGTMPHCNVLGGFLFTSILLTYTLIIESRKLWITALIVQFFALSLTFSRSAIFATVLGTICFWGWTLYKQGFRFVLQDKAKSLFYATCAAFAISGALLFQQYLSRGGIINYNALSAQSDAFRIALQNTAVQMIKDHPLTGVGFQQFSVGALPYLAKGQEMGGTHNIYLFLAAEMGLIALGAFLAFIVFVLNQVRNTAYTPLLASLLSIFVGFLFIGGCDFYPLLHQQGRLMFFWVAALLVSEARQRRLPAAALSFDKAASWQMFDKIAPTYDAINRILSFRQDLRWRRALAKHLPKKNRLRVLDLATGTADQILALLKHNASIQEIVGLDLSKEMMRLGMQKVKGHADKVRFVEASMDKIPFEDGSFDAASLSFGIRNVPDVGRALQEILRVLKPEGRCLILEFSLPPQPIRSPYLFYLRKVLPFIGGVFSKSPASYRYLNATIETFPSGNAFALLLKKAGFQKVEIHPMTLGAVTLYVGTKP